MLTCILPAPLCSLAPFPHPVPTISWVAGRDRVAFHLGPRFSDRSVQARKADFISRLAGSCSSGASRQSQAPAPRQLRSLPGDALLFHVKHVRLSCT